MTKPTVLQIIRATQAATGARGYGQYLTFVPDHNPSSSLRVVFMHEGQREDVLFLPQRGRLALAVAARGVDVAHRELFDHLIDAGVEIEWSE